VVANEEKLNIVKHKLYFFLYSLVNGHDAYYGLKVYEGANWHRQVNSNAYKIAMPIGIEMQ